MHLLIIWLLLSILIALVISLVMPVDRDEEER